MQSKLFRDNRLWLVGLLLSLLLAFGVFYPNNGQTERTRGSARKPVSFEEYVPPSKRFDAQRAFGILKQQVSFGPRCNGCEGHRKAREFFERYLRDRGAKVWLQHFSMELPRWEGLKSFTNIIARFHPQQEPRILLGTHYDTRARADSPTEAPRNRDTPIDGANDGASGVAVLLEIANIIAKARPAVGVDIVLFDGEDFGRPEEIKTNYFLGSRAFAMQREVKMPGYKPRFAVILDMVGDWQLRIPPRKIAPLALPENSVLHRSQKLDDAIHRVAEYLEVPQFGGKPGGDILDDHQALRAVGIPAVVLIDFPKDTWHTLQDIIENCRPESLGGVGAVLLHLLYHPETHPAFTNQD